MQQADRDSESGWGDGMTLHDKPKYFAAFAGFLIAAGGLPPTIAGIYYWAAFGEATWRESMVAGLCVTGWAAAMATTTVGVLIAVRAFGASHE